MPNPPVVDTPFPHLITDEWWPRDLLRDVADEMPSPGDQGWKRYTNPLERKFEGPPALWGPRMVEMVDAMRARGPLLEELFGIPDLTMETVGGGYHLIPPGGYLAVHTDFNRSKKTGLHRRLNLLVYLNDDWRAVDGGQLELWDDNGPAVEIDPEFGRTVVFATSSRSWHGHPKPTHRWRASVAAYFYSPQPAPGYSGDHSTVWHPNAS